jgi:hypothetical protein
LQHDLACAATQRSGVSLSQERSVTRRADATANQASLAVAAPEAVLELPLRLKQRN